MLSFAFLHSSHAVQTFTQEEEDQSLKQGKKAKNVCHIKIFKDKEKEWVTGTGILIRPDMVVTAAHLFEEYKKTLKNGNPANVEGYVDFRPTCLKASLKKAYEIDAVIIFPGADLDDTSADTDLAIVRLKRPVKNVTPVSIYKKGVLNTSQLRSHNPLNDDISHSILSKFSGYGIDTFGKERIRRTIKQICFLEHEEDEDDSSKGNNFVLASYVPSQMNDHNDEETASPFLRSLTEQYKDKQGFALIFHGDSGGPLTIKTKKGTFLIGIESIPGESEGAQEGIRTFEAATAASKRYVSYLCPLFTAEGKRRPELDTMFKKLDKYPFSDRQKLKKFIKKEKKFEAKLKCVKKELSASIADVKSLLHNNLRQDEFNRIKKRCENRKYTRVNFEFETGVEDAFCSKTGFLKPEKIIPFQEQCKRVIQELKRYKKEL